MEGRGPLIRIVLPYNIGLAFSKVPFDLLPVKMQAVLVIYAYLLTVDNLCKALKPFLVTETVISLPFVYQLFCIFKINTRSLPLALDIGTYSTVLIRTFVMDESRILQRPVYYINCPFHISFLVGIFYP